MPSVRRLLRNVRERIKGLHQNGSSQSGEKWLHGRCILKIEPRGFNGMDVRYKSKKEGYLGGSVG